MSATTDQKTVLFVDDEQNILSSLRRLMRREPWETLFANSAIEGLKVMQAQKVDLVVADMRMPEVDGAEFLTQVKETYPNTIRVILTGDADRDTIVTMLQNECAHKTLMKPWDPDDLKSLLKGLLDQQDAQQNGESWLHDTCLDIQSLPTLPQIYLQMKEALTHSDDLSIKRIGEIIEQDPSISVKLLKWANSAMFGQRSHIDHIQRAVVVLGMEIVQGLVLSMSVFDTLKPEMQEPKGYSRDDFWKHSFSCGLAARWIGKHLGQRDQVADKAFTAGLLHDLGKLYEDCYHHQGFSDAVDYAQAEQTTLREAEKRVMKVTHMETGAYLAKWWDLSPSLIEAIRWHHTPQAVSNTDQTLGIVHVANLLVQEFDQGSSGNFARSKIDQKVWRDLKIQKNQLQELKIHIRQAGI